MRFTFLVLFLGGALAAEHRLCGPQDYTATYGSCEKGQRNITWSISKNASCHVPEISRSIEGSGGCDCENAELTPQLSACEGQLESRFKLPDTDCNVPQDVEASICPQGSCGKTLCQCVEEDIGYAFTPCDNSNHRQLVSFWKRRCEPGSLELPPPSSRRRCDEQCSKGHVLAPPHETCTPCPAGTTSALTDVYGPPWNGLPNNSYTYCPNQGCSHWKPDSHNSYLASSPTVERAHLKLWVEIKTIPAYLSLEYRIVGKRFASVGSLVVFVDDVYVFHDYEQDSWTTMTVDLVSREYCLWEVHLSGSHGLDLPHLCLKSNHILPYSPARSFSKDSFHDTPFKVVHVGPGGGCDFEAPTGGSSWVMLAAEPKPGEKCSWEDLAKRAQDLGAQGIVLITASELVNVVTLHSDQLAIPVGYLRDEENKIIPKISHVQNAKFLMNNYGTGTAEVLIEYEKLADFDSTSTAQLRKIEIHGTKTAPTECTPCPEGTFSYEGSLSGCEACPVGSYSATPGSSSCIPCTGQVSPDGTSCFPLRDNCEADDFLPHATECKWAPCADCLDGLKPQRNVSFHPVNCVPSAGQTPDPQLISCECPAGQYLDQQLVCTQCPEGQVASEGSRGKVMTSGEACSACPFGDAAVPVLVYPTSSKWHPKQSGHLCEGEGGCPWRKECSSGSSNTCWLVEYSSPNDPLSAQQLQTGRGLAHSSADHRLVFETNFIPILGYAQFSYAALFSGKDARESARVRFSVFSVEENTDILVHEDIMPNEPGKEETFRIPKLSGRVQFHWEFLKTQFTEQDVVFLLKSFHANGTRDGSADFCEKCPDGMVCSGGHPAACPPGQVANGTSCVPCTGNTFTAFAGSKECRPCDGQFIVSEDHTRCVLDDCTVTVEGQTYDLAELGVDGAFDVTKAEKQKGAAAVADGNTYHVRLCPSPNEEFATRKKGTGNHWEVLGRVLSAEVMPTGVLRLHMREGDRCLTNDTAVRSRVEVDLVCDISGASVGAKIEDSMFREKNADPCVHRFHSYSRHACYQCNNESWSLVDTECIEGIQHVQWLRSDNCLGDEPPLPNLVACTIAAVDEVERHSSALTAILLFTLLVLLALGSVAFWLHRRKQALVAKYSRMSSRGATTAMQRQMGDLHISSGVEAPRSPGDGVASPTVV